MKIRHLQINELPKTLVRLNITYVLYENIVIIKIVFLRFSGEKIERGKRKIGEGPTRKARGRTNSGRSSKKIVEGIREIKRSCRKVALLCDVEIRERM